ncbi:Spore wall protein [Astathelohania contejeani]|uniref:Spore wall protein n=1 Tax=Astathelohania contejeani TaxID=164912 RepID=A0ABQ7HWB7_9MICR|nr:Spore wall protein [Thelohania contejeani]
MIIWKQLLYILIQCLLGGVLGESDIERRVVNVKFYISALARDFYMNKNMNFEVITLDAIVKLEMALNDALGKQTDHAINIKFNPTFELDVPPGINLDKCGADAIELASMLDSLNQYDSESSAIAVFTCDARPYYGIFKKVGSEIPYITHTVSTECTTRTLIFLEDELQKLKSVLITALIRAMGVNLLTPAKFEEVLGGDQGVDYALLISNDTFDAIRRESCGI